jgi:hypothetical protein
MSKFHQKLEVPRRNSIQFESNSNLESSLNFHSKSTWNLKKFLYVKLFLSSNPSKHILFQNFRVQEGSFSIGQSLKGFEFNLNPFKF